MAYRDRAANLEEYPVEIRIRILASQLHAAANLGMWCFAEEELFFSTCVQENEFLAFLQLGKCLDFISEKEDGWDHPLILSDALGLLWVAEHVFKNGKPVMLMIMGPVFTSRTSVKYIEDTLREHVSSIQIRRQMMRTLNEVPVIAMSSLTQHIKVMHFTLTGEVIQSSDFIFQNEKTRGLTLEEEEISPAETASMDRVVKGEKLILQAVRDGNLNYREIVEREGNYSTDFITNTGNALRDGKNSVLIFSALCSRAAMDGGLSVKTAKEMELRYAAQIEESTKITELKNIKDEMLEEYVRRVRDSQMNPLISRSIQECCDYIRINVKKPLTVETIAKKMGYTTYYFTKKFNKEMGIKVTDYIKQARIEYAKIALLTTKLSIQEISDSLHFGTRNYFSKVFHDVVGMTPAAYREKTGKDRC